jgi:hypothetical protein
MHGAHDVSLQRYTKHPAPRNSNSDDEVPILVLHVPFPLFASSLEGGRPLEYVDVNFRLRCCAFL